MQNFRATEGKVFKLSISKGRVLNNQCVTEGNMVFFPDVVPERVGLEPKLCQSPQDAVAEPQPDRRRGLVVKVSDFHVGSRGFDSRSGQAAQ